MIITRLKKWLQRDRTARVICVLGMHRSGTSLLTGSLQQAGVELHRFHQQNPHNLKGNRENQSIVDLHDHILADNGGRWDAPPENVRWHSAHEERAMQIIDEYSDYPIWGFKDPRTLLVLDGWVELLPQMEFVGIFRHPLAVAQSIHERNDKYSLQDGLVLWQRYNTLLLHYASRLNFPLICFDQDAMSLQADIMRLAGSLKLPSAKRIEFLDDALIHHKPADDVPMATEDAKLYASLQALAL